MVYIVDGILASGVDMLLEKDLVGFALQKMEIHPLMLLTLSMIFQTFSPTLHNPSTRHTRASYVEMILTMYSIDHQEDLNQQRISDVHDRWDKIEESQNELLNMVQSFCEMIKDYRNEKIDIRYRRECEIMIDELKGKFNGMSIEINKKKELLQREQAANVSTHTPKPSRSFNIIYDNDNDDDDYEASIIPLNDITSQIPSSIAITPVLSTLEPEDSLIMGDENLGTILEKESDEVIKSSVEDLVPIPSESEDTSGSDSGCDLPSCDDFSTIDVLEGKYVTFSNPLFDTNDDFTSSDDESLPEEDVQEENFKIYSNPLFECDEEYISSDVNHLFNEVLENIESKDSYVSNLDEPVLLVTPLSDDNEDECFDPGGEIDEIDAFLDLDVSTDIEDGYHDSEGDIIYLESLLINNTIPNLPPDVFLDHDPKNLKDEPDNEDLKSMVKVFDPGIHKKKFSPTYVRLPFEDHRYISLTYVIRIFLPCFTYPMESPFLLSSGSEDIIFDLGISAFNFSSLEPVAYKCPMEVFSSTYCPDYENSRACGFVHLSLDLQFLRRGAVFAPSPNNSFKPATTSPFGHKPYKPRARWLAPLCGRLLSAAWLERRGGGLLGGGGAGGVERWSWDGLGHLAWRVAVVGRLNMVEDWASEVRGGIVMRWGKGGGRGKLRKLKFLTEGVILFLESLLYDKSSPTTSEDLQANSNAYRIFCPKSHIPVADNVIFMEEIDLVFLLMTDHTTQELARIVKDSQFVILSRVSHLSFNWESDI
ncbi:hypothetical protein Tco_0367436 [Tanacetum coccineum]